MDVLIPILIFLVPILIAYKLCEWQVVSAFLVGLIVVPFFIIFLFHVYEIYFIGKSPDFNRAFTILAMFALFGLPIYLIIILPLYYFLQSLQFPINYSFPIVISIIMSILFSLMNERDWGWKQIAVILLCSYVHSYFILWLMAKLRSISIPG